MEKEKKNMTKNIKEAITGAEIKIEMKQRNYALNEKN